MRKGDTRESVLAEQTANAALKAEHLATAPAGHKCRTKFFRRCPRCLKFSCRQFVHGKCFACYMKEPKNVSWRIGYHKSWWEKNRDRRLVAQRARYRMDKIRCLKASRTWMVKNYAYKKLYGVTHYYKSRGLVVPPVWHCEDCGGLTAKAVRKLDAYCRSCKGIHVRRIEKKRPVVVVDNNLTS